MAIKPSFIVIGAAKAGTTSLCGLLSQHPEINFSEPKEPRFFSEDSLYSQGWSWYESCFQTNPQASHAGEGSVHYSMCTLFPNAASRIAAALPEAKLIYMVRHPLERIVSHWRMYDRSADPKFKGFNLDVLDPSYRANLIDASKYWLQLGVYRDYFPEQQIKVIFFEDFIQNQQQIIHECWDFLGVNKLDFSILKFDHKNEAHLITVARPELKKIKQLSAVKSIDRLISKDLRKSIKENFPGFYETKGSEPVWDPDVKRKVLEEVQEDAAKFLNFYQKPDNYWNLKD